MKIQSHILKILKYSLIAIVLVGAIGFANVKQSKRYIEEVHVNIDNQFENYFIDQSDVFSLVHETGKSYLMNVDVGQLDLREIESNIEAHRFVGDAEIYLDLKGKLTIEVSQNRPIARIIDAQKKDRYVGSTGLILPESSHYTARVLLISLDKGVKFSVENIQDSKEGEELFKLLSFIENDPFWKAQIAGIHVHKNHELTLYPQVTKQNVRFGPATEIENKMKRLKVFYKEILPYKGWNKYSEVNLNYKNQIVCK